MPNIGYTYASLGARYDRLHDREDAYNAAYAEAEDEMLGLLAMGMDPDAMDELLCRWNCSHVAFELFNKLAAAKACNATHEHISALVSTALGKVTDKYASFKADEAMEDL